MPGHTEPPYMPLHAASPILACWWITKMLLWFCIGCLEWSNHCKSLFACCLVSSKYVQRVHNANPPHAILCHFIPFHPPTSTSLMPPRPLLCHLVPSHPPLPTLSPSPSSMPLILHYTICHCTSLLASLTLTNLPPNMGTWVCMYVRPPHAISLMVHMCAHHSPS